MGSESSKHIFDFKNVQNRVIFADNKAQIQQDPNAGLIYGAVTRELPEAAEHSESNLNKSMNVEKSAPSPFLRNRRATEAAAGTSQKSSSIVSSNKKKDAASLGIQMFLSDKKTQKKT